ncbi:MAG: baseplate J/gp47 family protein [Tissierellaceae bacterium]|nr:baseplate J/gp47 family protein [Tissierellaceae bacterium]
MIGDYLEQYTFEYLIESALSRVPNTIDKREGSIIYDALAPACYELSEYYMRLRRLLQDTFAETANGQYLDLRVAEQGIKRFEATAAIKKGVFETESGTPLAIEIGSRFSTITDRESLNYIVTAPYEVEGQIVPGNYQLTCETIGTAGNAYVGNIMPISYIQGLSSAVITDLIVPARDIETDDDLRARYFLALKDKPFGGNIAQYVETLKNIEGVGEVQIYPVWDGGGTVKCSVIDASFNIITNDFINIIQEQLDPTPQGTGLGLVPIGHVVTITTPEELTINIAANILLMSGYTKAQVEQPIKEALEAYILELRKAWGTANDFNQYILGVYISRINAAILNVAGVSNVTEITINSLPNDLNLVETAERQELPILGVVTLNV